MDNNVENLVELMDCFIQRIQQGVSLSGILKSCGYTRVGIYGMGRLGRRLYDELKELVVYTIDRNNEMIYGDVPLKGPDEELTPVDLIIITPICDIDAIYRLLRKKSACEIITFRELMNMN